MQGKGKNCLPIEALCEFNVLEILNDGREIREGPLSAAENFQRIVNGIDFTNKNFDREDGINDESRKIPDKTWQYLRDQIRTSYMESCAFIELMAVLKETKCLTLCQVAPNDQERDLDLHAITFLGGKKMALSAAANILLKGAEKFRSRYFELSQTEQRIAGGRKSVSYHEGLMQLRKSWRLKLGPNGILGDVSLRCIGSRAKEGGNFEVFESDVSKSEHGSLNDVVKVKFSTTMESLLTRDRCTGRLRVAIRHLDPNRPKDWYQFLNPPPQISCGSEQFIRAKSEFDKLCIAQNVLMCREILSTLSYEASLIGLDKAKNDLVAFSSLGKVVASVFPGVQLSISLEKETDAKDEGGEESYEAVELHPGLSTLLKHILFLQHIHSWSNIASVPNPPTGPVQVPQKLRAGGAILTLRNRGHPSNDASMPIITACVAGFGGPAASTWMALQEASNLGSNHPQAFAAPVGQDRYTYFNDWGVGQNIQQYQQQYNQTAAEDITVSGLTLSGLEHALRSNNASSTAISCILGSSEVLLMQALKLARHRVLRQRVARCLTYFVRGGGGVAAGMCVTVLWHSVASPLSSAVNVTFNSMGYSSFRTRVTICVGVESVTIYGVCGAAQSLIIPAMADLQSELLRILKTQELRNQMLTLQGIASKFLGWIQLGCFSAPSVETPSSSLLMASRSGNRIVCIRGGNSTLGGELEFLVAKTTQNRVTDLASDGELLQNTLTDTASTPNTSRGGQGDSIGGRFTFRKVDLTRIPGRHVVAKIESLLTCLNCA